MYKINQYFEDWSPIKGKIKNKILYQDGIKSKKDCIQVIKDDNLDAKSFIITGNKIEVKKINKAGIPYTDLYKVTKSNII